MPRHCNVENLPVREPDDEEDVKRLEIGIGYGRNEEIANARGPVFLVEIGKSAPRVAKLTKEIPGSAGEAASV
jgi:hypothetical protein